MTRVYSCQDPKKEHGTELQPFLHHVEVMRRHASECVDRSRGANFICFFCLVRSESLWRQISDRSVPGPASERASSLSIAGAGVLGGCGGVVTCI